MPTIQMIKGEKFTFGKVNNNAVLLDSTCNATSANTEFHGQVLIDKRPTFSANFTEASGVDNNFTAVPLKIQRADTGGEQINLLQRGSGDNYIRFQTSNVTTTGNSTGNGDWVMGADNAGGTINSFKIYNNSGFSSNDYYEFKIDDSGHCYTAADLIVGATYRRTGVATSNNEDWAVITTDADNMASIKYNRSLAEDPNQYDRGYAAWDPNAGAPRFRFYHYNGGSWSSFYIYENGTAQANGVAVTSDARWKNDVTPLSGSLDIIKQLNPVSFTWNEISGRGGDEDLGFIAQEVEAHVPELVYTSPDVVKYEEDGVTQAEGTPTTIDNPKTMEYGKLTAHLTKAIQEQQTMIEELKARIEVLENA